MSDATEVGSGAAKEEATEPMRLHGPDAQRWRVWLTTAVTLVHRAVLPLVLAVLLVVFTTQSEAFLTFDNLLAILSQAAPVAIAGIGITFVLIGGGIDISQGAMMAAASVIAVALIARGGVPEVLAIAIAIVAGTAVGAVNGAFAEFARVPAFIATLATALVIRGCLFVYTDSRSIGLGSGEGRLLRELGTGKIGAIPISVILMCAMYAVAAVAMSQTRWGLRTYGVGSSAAASRVAGVRVARHRLTTYMLSGAVATIAGLVLAGRLASGSAGLANGAEFEIITAAVLGGTSIYGGSGRVVRTLLGAVLLAMMSNGLVLMNVSSFYQAIAVGVVLLFALSIDSLSASSGGGAR